METQQRMETGLDGMGATGSAVPGVTGGPRAALRRPGGEFRSAVLEESFAASQAIENFRHARILLIASVILNTMFLASDWRFHGTSHFWVAIPARLLVIAAAAVAMAILHRHRDPRHREHVMIGWMAVNGLGVAALVSSRSDIAMLVMSILPIVYYLAVPVSFLRRIVGGMACSLAMIAGYESGVGDESISFGMVLAMLILNVAMALVVARSNRLERLEWLATRAERRISAELTENREQLEKMFAVSPVPMVVTTRDDGRVLRINDAGREFIGVDLGDIADIYVNPDDRTFILNQLEAEGTVSDLEMLLRRADGTIRTVLVNASMLDLSTGRHIIASVADISDRKAAEQDLKWLASTDTLTGLPNRMSFFAAGRAEMMRAMRTGAPLALLMADLDNFKQVNDGFGHQGGDEALRSFATVCRGIVGEGMVVARIGGEEFAILLRNTDITGAAILAERLRESLERHVIQTRRGTIRVTLSIGVAMVDPHDRDLDPALARADGALYAAKNGGRNRIALAHPTPARRAG